MPPSRLTLLASIAALAAGFAGGYMIATDQGLDHFRRSFSHESTSDLRDMVKALGRIRDGETTRGLAGLDLLLLRKLDGLSTVSAVADYEPGEIDRYFRTHYNMAPPDRGGETWLALRDRIEKDVRPSVVEVAVGSAAPDFELPTLEGQPFRLSNKRGRVVLLTFFATWCSFCVEELDRWKKELTEQTCSGDLQIIVVGVDEKETTGVLQNFVRKRGFPFTFVRDTGENLVFRQYAPRHEIGGSPDMSLPTTFLIGRDGRVVERFVGYSEEGFRKLLRHLSDTLTGGPPQS